MQIAVIAASVQSDSSKPTWCNSQHAATDRHNTSNRTLGSAVGLVRVRDAHLLLYASLRLKRLGRVGRKLLGTVVAHKPDFLRDLVFTMKFFISSSLSDLLRRQNPSSTCCPRPRSKAGTCCRRCLRLPSSHKCRSGSAQTPHRCAFPRPTCTISGPSFLLVALADRQVLRARQFLNIPLHHAALHQVPAARSGLKRDPHARGRSNSTWCGLQSGMTWRSRSVARGVSSDRQRSQPLSSISSPARSSPDHRAQLGTCSACRSVGRQQVLVRTWHAHDVFGHKVTDSAIRSTTRSLIVPTPRIFVFEPSARVI